MQPKASRCLLKKSANRMFIQLDLYMPQSDLSPYRDLLGLRHLQRRADSSYNDTPESSFTQKLCALKRFQLTPQPALLRQHSFVRLDIIRKECLSFYFCSFEAPSLRYGPNQGRAIPSTLGSSQAQNLVNPRNRGSQIGLGLLPKPTHSLSPVGGHGGAPLRLYTTLRRSKAPLLSRSPQPFPGVAAGAAPPQPVYDAHRGTPPVGSLTLRELRSAQILRPTPGSL